MAETTALTSARAVSISYIGLELEILDEPTREHMLAELDHDERQATLYISPRLSPHGRDAYPQLLREAIRNGDDSTLGQALAKPGVLNEREAYGPEKLKTRKMNSRAPQALAEGEFNRFYIRGLCARLCRSRSRQGRGL